MGLGIGWREVSHGCCFDDDVSFGRTLHYSFTHLSGGLYENKVNAIRRCDVDWAGDQNHLGTHVAGGFGYGVSHFAARTVADVADRIDRLARWSGSDEYGLAAKLLREVQQVHHARDDLFVGGEASS